MDMAPREMGRVSPGGNIESWHNRGMAPRPASSAALDAVRRLIHGPAA
jgi:hypothetical protein